MNKKLNYEYRWSNFYCYPNSYVLKNMQNIRSKEELDNVKLQVTALRTAQILQERISGIFDFYHLKCIHKLILGDIYEWAGKIRSVDPAKENPFCQFELISDQANKLLIELKEENYLASCKGKDKISKRLAYYLGRLNEIHPFREGNGLCQLIFMEHLAWRNGYQLDFINISEEEISNAYVNALASDYELLESIFYHNLTKRE